MAIPKVITPSFRKEYRDGDFVCELKPLSAKDTDAFLNLTALTDKWDQLKTEKDKKKAAVQQFKDFTKDDINRMINVVAASITDWAFEPAPDINTVGEFLSPFQLISLFGEVMALNFRDARGNAAN
ncbi:MAG: hypothetical protein WC261_06165 [Synergistaceae bacterium]|jgi:hypothetical protein|nr:hypothetical protein [Candidatus Omnitrophota bacterium]